MTSLPLAKPTELGLDPARLQLAYDLLEDWTSGADPEIPGGTIAVGRAGKLVEPRFFGRQGAEPGAPPLRRDGLFLLASITKPIVYMGAMMLVERGLLNLSDRVTHYIPEFAAHHKEATLVAHLFTHTSGLPDMLENNAELRKQHAPLQEFIRGAIRDTVPLFPPGTSHSYQSMGTLIVAELVQRLSGLPISKFLKKEIFDPLGLKSTGLGSVGFARERLVRVETPAYQHNSDFGWNSPYWTELGAPWGGMFSTPDDFAIICQCLLNGGAYGDVRLLSPFTVQRMTENRLDDYPDLPEPIRRCRRWGLGWQMNHVGESDSWSSLLGPHVFGHTGATGTMVWMDRERDGFCMIFTTTPRANAPGRLVQISSAVASAFH
ncbi:serine hydrolase domain-containing protein [Lignipirellula cremea]|uniref:Penicillin-binding protein 4 n=1 Tax=Lignipirellula cremea TaxID=2528010 RepID=A0A518DRF7_9BACT|nr:serine hydrolase domain-containing protein [Lignipirellula cremea]QDU94430.1 Penicillin-binding protein 4* [Lignipirellula cremea]